MFQVDPENPAILKLQEMAKKEKVTTGKTTIADEKQWNVFMRLDTAPVRYVFVGSSRGYAVDSQLFIFCREATGLKDPVKVMDKLREMKNSFRG